MEQALGTLTLILAILMAVIALPSQIKKNALEKRCGQSFWMTILPLSVYLSRAGYAVTIGSWYILIPDTFGIIFSAVLLFQYFKYRK